MRVPGPLCLAAWHSSTVDGLHAYDLQLSKIAFAARDRAHDPGGDPQSNDLGMAFERNVELSEYLAPASSQARPIRATFAGHCMWFP